MRKFFHDDTLISKGLVEIKYTHAKHGCDNRTSPGTTELLEYTSIQSLPEQMITFSWPLLSSHAVFQIFVLYGYAIRDKD